GGADGAQNYTVTSDNPNIKATIAQGKFLTMNVSHTASGPDDMAGSFSGTMTYQLFDDLTPIATARIETLVNQGFYNGRNIHRIPAGFPGATDFIVQGGSVNNAGGGSVNQPGFPWPDQYVQQLAYTGAGQLAAPNAGNDTNDSGFFVTTGSPRFLDF